MIEHIWIESYIPYANYRGAVIDGHGKTWLGLDTSIKVKDYQYNSPIDLFQQSAVKTQLSGMRDEYLSAMRPETPLEYLEGKLSADGYQLQDVMMRRDLSSEIMNILPASMQFNQKLITHEYTEIPDELKHRVRIIATDSRSLIVGPMFDMTLDAVKLSNRQIAVSYEPETVEDQQIIDAYGGLDNTPAYLVRLRPVLNVDGERIAVGRDGLPMGSDYNLTIELISPNGTEKVTGTHIAGNLSAIGIVAGRVTPSDSPLPQGGDTSNPSPLAGEGEGEGDKTAEQLLYEEAINYTDWWNKAEDELSSLLHLTMTRPIPAVTTIGGVIDVAYVFGTPHRFTWKGVYVDAGLRSINITPSNSSLTQGGDTDRKKAFMQLSALQGSVLENRIFEDDFQVESISTAKLFELANTNQIQIVTIDKTNIDTTLPSLPFDEQIKEDIANSVNQNYAIRIPNSEIVYDDWTGTGYIKENPATGEAGYMLSGEIAGGMTAESPEKWVDQNIVAKLKSTSPKTNTDPNAAATIHKIPPTDGQTGTVGQPLGQQLAVAVTDSKGVPVQGASVTFRVIAGGGKINGADSFTTTTDARGIAKAPLTLGKYTKDNPKKKEKGSGLHNSQNDKQSRVGTGKTIMARPLRIEYDGAFYHVTARGNERKDIYKNDRDREQFLAYTKTAVERYQAKIHAYCLMSNHYHILIETPSGNLSQIMRHINGSYTTYYNVKRKRSGHLFQGRYKAILIDKDEYAGELSRYIHLNPVRAKMTERPEEYVWSSYKTYIGKAKVPKWLTEEFILGYYGTKEREQRQNYRKFVDALTGKEYDSPLKEAVAECILGGQKFIEEIKERYLGEKSADRDVPAIREIKKGPSFEEIKEVVQQMMGDNDRTVKKTALFMIHRYSGRTLKEIGKNYGISESGVSQASSRFSKELKGDKSLGRTVEQISKRLGLSNV